MTGNDPASRLLASALDAFVRAHEGTIERHEDGSITVRLSSDGALELGRAVCTDAVRAVGFSLLDRVRSGK